MMIKPYSDVKMANYLVENRPRMNVDETRLFLTLVASVNKDDIELNTLNIPVSEFAALWGIPLDAAYSKLKTALRGLRSKEFFVEGVNPQTGKMRFISTSYITTAAYEEGCAYATVKISDEFKPYLLALKACYTSYVLENVMNLSSVNAIRNYELLKQYQGLGQRTFTIAEYKQLLKIDGKYAQNTDLRIKVIDPAVMEINENTDINVSYEFVGRGQRAKLKFTIKAKPAPVEVDPNQVSLYDDQEVLLHDTREAICLGFSGSEFSEFSDYQLRVLKDLAWPNVTEADVAKHSCLSLPEARQWATSEYLQRVINEAKAHTPDQSVYGYVKAMLKNEKGGTTK